MLNPKKALLSMLFFIAPFLPYALDNLSQTGNPIFPYYNNIFHSEYFADNNYYDRRYKREVALYPIWPIYTSVINPQYGDDSGIVDYAWAVGYIGIFCTFLLNKKINRNTKSLRTLAILLTLVWILLLAGYMRYAMIIPFLYLTIIASAITQATRPISSKLVSAILKAGIIVIALLLPSYRYAMPDTKNMHKLLTDKNTKIYISNNAWGVIGDNSALTTLVREKDAPIINLNILQNSTSEKSLNLAHDKIQGKDFYVLIDSIIRNYDLDKIRYIYKNGYDIDLIRVYTSNDIPYLSDNETAALYKVHYTGEFPKTPTFNEDSFYPLSY